MTHHIRVSARALIIQDGAVLLVEFDDEHGLHYNLPGGGVQPGETVTQGVRREVWEEANVAVEVGPLAFVVEYEPAANAYWAGPTPALSLIFEARLAAESVPRLPERPDPNETAVKWVPLAELESVELLPHLAPEIIAYANGTRGRVYYEEPIRPERAARYLRA